MTHYTLASVYGYVSVPNCPSIVEGTINQFDHGLTKIKIRQLRFSSRIAPLIRRAETEESSRFFLCRSPQQLPDFGFCLIRRKRNRELVLRSDNAGCWIT